MRKSGFTLVEMLIVVVIIWVLASALLPRLNNYISKTRDLKRQADLMNIAAAIEMYWNDHGELPLRDVEEPNFTCDPIHNCKNIAKKFWYASALSTSLSSYIKSVPTDPNKNLQNNIEWHSPIYNPNEYQKKLWEYKHKNGEYVYMHVSRGEETDGYHIQYSNAALLIAKVETPEYANYITTKRFPGDWEWEERWKIIRKEHDFAFAHIENSGAPYDINKISLCDTIEKTTDQEPTATLVNGKWICKYTSEDQLYYIVKIE